MSINLNVNANTAPFEAQVQAAVNRIRSRPIKITVDDKGATQPLGNMRRSADDFSKSMEAANARILAFGASMAVINGVGNAFKPMVQDMIEVEKKLADINVVMDLSTQNLERFGNGLFNVAKEAGAAFNVAADAATEYARQGLGVEESLKRTRDALILTRLTGMDSANAVKSLTAAMNTYGAQIKDTTQLVSKFAAVDVKFAVSAEDFADAIARTGATARDAGVHIDELIGFVTRGRGITVHRSACKSLPLLNNESDRLVPVNWNVKSSDYFNVLLKTVGQDYKGWLKDMSECISKQNINIASVDIKVTDSIAEANFIVQVNNNRQLNRLMKKMTKLKHIDYVERTGR